MDNPDIQIRFRIIASGTLNFDYEWYEDGILIQSGVSQTNGIPILINIGGAGGPSYGDVQKTCRAKVIFNSGTGSLQNILQLLDLNHVAGPDRVICNQSIFVDLNSPNSDITCRTSSRRGLSGPPTYLETLDKLDQYSSAQYIPNRR